MAFEVNRASYQRIKAHEELFQQIRQEVEELLCRNKYTYRLVLLVKFCVYTSLLAGGYMLIFHIHSFVALLLLYIGIARTQFCP